MKRFSTLLKILAVGSSALVLSACYGVRMKDRPSPNNTSTKKAGDNAEKADKNPGEAGKKESKTKTAEPTK